MDNNRANQLNPNNSSFWQSRGQAERPSNWLGLLADILGAISSMSQADLNNRSNQLNPNNPTYWSSRGSSKPEK